MRRLLPLLLFLLFLLTCFPASAQYVQQFGNATPNHGAMYCSNGVICDAGTAAQGLFSGLGTTGAGPTICANSGPRSGPYNQLCLGTTQSGGGTISLYNYNGAGGGLSFVYNGTPLSTALTGTGTQGYNTTWQGTNQLGASGGCVNLISMGGVPTGLADSTAAFNAAFALLASPGGCIYAPAGKYLFNGQVTVNLPAGALFDLTIRGDGPDATTFYWPSSNGLIININDTNGLYQSQSVHLSGFAVTTASANAGTGLAVDEVGTHNGGYGAASSIDHIAFRSDDHYLGNNYWTNAIVIGGGASNFNIDSIVVQGGASPLGNGIALSGLAGNIGTVFNITNSMFSQCGIAVVYGAYIQGVALANDNFTGCNYGLKAASGLASTSQLSVVNSQFGVFSGNNAGIETDSAIPGTVISNNVFFMAANTVGINLVSTGPQFTVTGNTFFGSSLTGTYGTQVTTNAGGGTFTGNVFNALGIGIALQAGSQYVNAGYGNTFFGNTTAIGNSGTGNVVSGGNVTH